MAQVRPAPEEGRSNHQSPRLRPGSAAIACCLALLGPVAPAAIAMTLAEAERLAVDRDAVLRQLEAQSDAMQQRAVADGQWADPKLRVGAVNVPTDSFSLDTEDMTMLELGISQEFRPGRTRELAHRRMEQSASAVEAGATDRSLAVRREVRRAWTELAYLSRARELVEDQQSWVEQMRSAARARYASGSGQQIDVLRAGLDVAMLREQLLDLDRDEAVRRAQLARWIGAEEARQAGPFQLPARAELEPLATLQDRLLEHPAQMDFERRIESAETAVDLARQRYRPAWMLDVSYGYRADTPDGQSRSDMMSAMLSVDLPLFRSNRQDREVAAAQADARSLHDEHEDHLRRMSAMLEEAWAVADRTMRLEKYFENELLPLADQSVQAALIGYQSNRTMVDQVIEARRVALETWLKHLRLAADRAQAQYDIDYLVGEQP
jgi:outer membrane protein TolC